MSVYTIDLALRSACHDYAGLVAALRRAGARPVIGKRWLVAFDGDATALLSDLLGRCAPGDALFVVELSRAGGLTPAASAAGLRPAPRRSRLAAPSG